MKYRLIIFLILFCFLSILNTNKIFAGNSVTIVAGSGSATLTWSVSGPPSCVASTDYIGSSFSGKMPSSGSVTVTPGNTVSGNFSFTCTGITNGVSLSDTANLTVCPLGDSVVGGSCVKTCNNPDGSTTNYPSGTTCPTWKTYCTPYSDANPYQKWAYTLPISLSSLWMHVPAEDGQCIWSATTCSASPACGATATYPQSYTCSSSPSLCWTPNGYPATTCPRAICVTSYTITYSAGTGGSITGTTPQTVASGNNGTQVTATPNTGYHFTSWSDAVATAARTDANVTANKTVTASFAVNNCATTPTTGVASTITGSPAADGQYWTAAASGACSYVCSTGYTASGSGTASAGCTINTYTVTFSSVGATTNASPTSKVVNYNTGFGSLTSDPTRNGYTFTGWKDINGTAFTGATGITADVTLYAQWTQITHTVTFNGNGSDGGTTATQTINEGASVALTSNGFTRTGYTFAGWATSAGGVVAYADGALYTMSTSNVTLYAKWTPTIYTCSPPAPSGLNFTSRPAATGNGTWTYAASGECTWSCDSGYSKNGTSCLIAIPATPTNLTAASSACGNNWINLAWDKVSTATTYTVYRGGVVQALTATCGADNICRVSDTGLTLGAGPYSYVVTANNAGGDSAPTAPKSATVAISCIVAPVVSLTLSKTSVVSGEKPTITWTSTGADTCTSSTNWSTSGLLNGSGLVSPIRADSTFTFSCTNAGGTTSATPIPVTLSSLPVVSWLGSRGCVLPANGSGCDIVSSWIVSGVTSDTLFNLEVKDSNGNLVLLPDNIKNNPKLLSIIISLLNIPTAYAQSGGLAGGATTRVFNAGSYTLTLFDRPSRVQIGSTQSMAVCSPGYLINASGQCVLDIPATPINFSANASTCGNNWINLAWDKVSTATTYTVYRGGVVQALTATCGADNICRVSDTGFTLGSGPYSYVVEANNAVGSSGPSTGASAKVAVNCVCTNPLTQDVAVDCDTHTGNNYLSGNVTRTITKNDYPSCTFPAFPYTPSPYSVYKSENCAYTCINGASNPYPASCNVFTVTPSAGANGSITLSNPQSVNSGNTTFFTITPNYAYIISSVGGTCGGSLVGNIYTTNAVSGNCTVTASFTPGLCSPLNQDVDVVCDTIPGNTITSGKVVRRQTASAYPVCAFPAVTIADPIVTNTCTWSCDNGSAWPHPASPTCPLPSVDNASITGNNTEDAIMSYTCSYSTKYSITRDGVTIVPTTNYTGPVSIDKSINGSIAGNYVIHCWLGTITPATRAVPYYDPEPLSTDSVMLSASPRTTKAGTISALTWSINNPLPGCTLTAYTVCSGVICSPERTAATNAITSELLNGNTDANDPYGSRTMKNALRKVATSPGGTKAMGKKSLKIDYTTDFTVDCNVPSNTGKPNPTKTLRVQITTDSEG